MCGHSCSSAPYLKSPAFRLSSASPQIDECTCSCWFVFFCGDHGSRGWYDNPQPVLRPVFTAAQCTTVCVKCLYVWVVCGYCHSNSACLVSVTAIFIVTSPGCKFLQVLGLCVLCPTGTKWPKPTLHPSKVIAGWCYGDRMWCTLPSIYLLSDSQHPLQLRCSYSWLWWPVTV